MQITLDHGPDGQAVRFGTPKALISADTPEAVPQALAALDQARERGQWLAGYASYELGYVLEPHLQPLLPAGRQLPLLHFGLHDHPPEPLETATAPPPAGAWELGDFVPRWHLPRYREAFERVRAHIACGDVYQANLTFPHDARFAGDSSALYAALAARQTVGYGALIEQEDGPDILCRSPELFFRTDAERHIEARPMKGTAARADTPEADLAARLALQQDEKNRAENLMIVDLLRNDIGRIAEIGSVTVPELFTVESYATVHQMVSSIRARLREPFSLSDIFHALFPCGSITGAPKIRAMELIRELEPWPRDVYCGCIGWAAPDGRSSFNVAIRTLLIGDGIATLSVGGGLVWDSRPETEYEEALWKTRFAQQP